MITFEELKNTKNFGDITLEEYEAASKEDIHKMIFAEAMRDSRRVMCELGTKKLLSPNYSEAAKARLRQMLTAFSTATDDEFIEHYMYASQADGDAWIDRKCAEFRKRIAKEN